MSEDSRPSPVWVASEKPQQILYFSNVHQVKDFFLQKTRAQFQSLLNIIQS